MCYVLDIVAIIISFCALTVSIIAFFDKKITDADIRFTNSFNTIYNDIFSLRKIISVISQDKKQYEFYYELDIINSNIEIEEKILDHLTVIENYFAMIMHNQYKKVKESFEALVSVAFYQRIIALYPYILYKRKKNNNEELFKDYDGVISMMKEMEKISKNVKLEQNKCYIGIRESDIEFASSYFTNSICLFSDNAKDDSFSVRQNQNIVRKEISLHYRNLLEKAQKENMKYVFYNQLVAYDFPNEILNRTICINSYDILNFLNNKLLVRQWLAKHGVPIVAYETFFGKDILISKLSLSFPKEDKYVVQSYKGGGGIGTYLFNQKNASEVRKQLCMFQQYIVSPYIPSVSANIHIFVSEKQTIVSPASIQIIEIRENQLCYRGCDFIAFRSLSEQVKEKIKDESIKISQLLRKKGYRGIAGIDFIIDDSNNIYVSEINPRFQASTILLDQYLKTKASENPKEASNSFILNEMAFIGGMVSTLCYTDEINLSCYYYYNDIAESENYINKYNLLKKNNLSIYMDGAKYYMKNNMINKQSYLYRVVFPHSICKISPDTELWINNNIKVEDSPKDTLSLKIALLNQGVRINNAKRKFKNATYNSIDIKLLSDSNLFESTYINCAYEIHFSQYSPFNIDIKSTVSELFYYNKKICNIEVEYDLLSDFSEIERNILYVATDRLRIKIVSGCENKNIGQGCKFCNVPISKRIFSIGQIIDSLEHLKQKENVFRHILIGGGSRLDENAWQDIIQICNYLKEDDYYKDMPISLMSILPPENMLHKLKDAGVEEVAFNIEIANEQIATNMMPAKRKGGKDAYYNILMKAVSIFGVGNVRSALLVGLDKKEELYNEIITMAEMDVIPCLSAFRSLPDSDLENELPPSNEYLLEVYEHSQSILSTIDGTVNYLGPVCDACCNNMLKV